MSKLRGNKLLILLLLIIALLQLNFVYASEERVENYIDENNMVTPSEIHHPHPCHPGDYHRHCDKPLDIRDDCGCYFYKYVCCCGRVMDFGVEYCQKHVN
ncbi:hypothetical protein [Alkaliphilus oremlandii]|uniref:Uncharacterized protein n=1 Tax=Alkaliphilus oremlandii (strain OhILAs) TaxID=350688 RepID=A8MJ05_ALKOO|nr:hypothetical protein [Alkaliphilus oremlandii]ABW19787.1 hypothetical protein Clos_2254 [Alkaliphilus oremlandii OhILAs]